ncbi:MAG: hypothetical protein H6Q17_539 [Bacteroidetes bacterium]|nr:hypothetical protein [Bacteroidota bacterium]
MKNLLIVIIGQLLSDRKQHNEVPSHVLLLELQKEVYSQIYSALNELEVEGKIEIGHTLNDRWIKLK